MQIGLFTAGTTLMGAGSFAILFKSSLSPTSGLTVLFAGATLVLALTERARRGLLDNYAEQIRERVERESTSMQFNVQPGGLVQVNSSDQDFATIRNSDSLEKQEAILREIYTQGLAQARVSFRVSIVFASIGASFLLLGIGLAIFHARTDGAQYASIVAGAAGVVVNLTSNVFFVQSNRARMNMAEQGTQLREESQEDRRLNAARELTNAITNDDLRNEVRAKLALRLLNTPEPANGAKEQTDAEPDDQGNADAPAK